VARLLVAGDRQHVAARGLLTKLVAQLRQDGHDAGQFDGDPAKEIRGADGVVAVLDHADADTAAIIAFAAANEKPVFGLTSGGAPPALKAFCTLHLADDEAGLLAGLPAFYEQVKPFAGRVVRDRIPSLVKEAGHKVSFRELGDDEKPRFLKQKIANEARELLRADLGKEKEEIADILEALEAFIKSRGYDRDDLKRVKEAKKKRRGAFDKVFVVESTTPTEAAAPEPEPLAAKAPPRETAFFEV
jgi:predicted house-cleaning noncanonical NTP pyrophosphatase (MazG superfamily)